MRDDELILESLEEVYYSLQKAIKQGGDARSIHVLQWEKMADVIRSQRRIVEEISIPARLVCEQILECQAKDGQIALEAENLRQTYSSVGSLQVGDFSLIHLTLGDLSFTWRDENYTYYFYPDKVELRAVDEKSAVKLFFSIAFSRQTVARFPEILTLPNVAYVHPQIEKWCEKVSE